MMDPRTATFAAGHDDTAFRHAEQRADVRFGDTSHTHVASVPERVQAFFGPRCDADAECTCQA
jgi:hypothetical protein